MEKSMPTIDPSPERSLEVIAGLLAGKELVTVSYG
jgi:hypothetical protein